jgi:hypothetical protein
MVSAREGLGKTSYSLERIVGKDIFGEYIYTASLCAAVQKVGL